MKIIKIYFCLEYEMIGCYKDTESRAIDVYPKFYYDDPVTYCYARAKSYRYTYFAVQDGTQCRVGGDSYFNNYTKYGLATNCKDGKGGLWANNVYKVKGKGMSIFNYGLT